MATAQIKKATAPPQIECAQVYGGTGASSMPISLPGLQGYLYSQPCQADRGGDIYYMSICGSGLLTRFCLADVVGHGSDVAIVSDETHALLRESVNWTDHRRVLRQLNRALHAKGLESLTTAAMFTYFPPTQNLTFSYAGHPRGWLWSSREKSWSALTVLDPKGDEIADLPLAVAETTPYSRGEIRIESNDIIVVATDGVTDAIDCDLQRFGEERLHATLAGITKPTPQDVVETIVQRIKAYCGASTFSHDDVTVFAAEASPVSRFDAIKTMFTNRVLRPFRGRGNSNPKDSQ